MWINSLFDVEHTWIANFHSVSVKDFSVFAHWQNGYLLSKG